jgi:hypothetical protein
MRNAFKIMFEKILSGVFKEDEKGRACSTNEGEEDIGGKAGRKETTGKNKT